MKAPSGRIQAIVGWSMMAAAVCLAGFAAFWAWLLRDGLGPDSISSSGLAAVHHAVLGGWHLFLPAALVAIVGLMFIRRARRVRPNNSFKPNPLRGSA